MENMVKSTSVESGEFLDVIKVDKTNIDFNKVVEGYLLFLSSSFVKESDQHFLNGVTYAAYHFRSFLNAWFDFEEIPNELLMSYVAKRYQNILSNQEDLSVCDNIIMYTGAIEARSVRNGLNKDTNLVLKIEKNMYIVKNYGG